MSDAKQTVIRFPFTLETQVAGKEIKVEIGGPDAFAYVLEYGAKQAVADRAAGKDPVKARESQERVLRQLAENQVPKGAGRRAADPVLVWCRRLLSNPAQRQKAKGKGYKVAQVNAIKEVKAAVAFADRHFGQGKGKALVELAAKRAAEEASDTI
jgi:hypothetical protein